MNEEIERIKRILMGSRITKANVGVESLLNSGSTLLNLACTGHAEGAFMKGTYVALIGDSSAGKSFLSRTCLAEATINPQFENYRLIYDDVEYGVLMDTEKYFGLELAERLEAPQTDKEGGPLYSETIEEFYFNIDDALMEAEKDNKPFIYVLDSMDALSSDYEGKKFEEKKTANRKGTKAKGDYGDGKAKSNSANLRPLIPRLRDTGSILIVVIQTRDNIDAGLYGPKKTRSGGRALTFYANMEIWLSKGAPIKISVKGKDRQVGITSRAKVKKNRLTGREREVEFPIFYSVGIDDIGGMVDYLVAEGKWAKKKGGYIDADDLGLSKRRDDLIAEIEDKEMEDDVKMVVAETWEEIEAACEVSRKSKYE